MSSDKLESSDALGEGADEFKKKNSTKKGLIFGRDFEEFAQAFRYPITAFLLGLILVGFGVIYLKVYDNDQSSNIEVLEDVRGSQDQSLDMVVEIAGSVEKPGVYKLAEGSRVEDLLIVSGGISADADREWVNKYINRASKLTDGQKIYIPAQNEQSNESTAKFLEGSNVSQGVRGSGSQDMVNINTASLSELDSLPGIGQVYGQNIIEHRPYSSVQELQSKGVLKKSVYEKIKDSITVY